MDPSETRSSPPADERQTSSEADRAEEKKALKPYYAAARWIPLGINPFVSLSQIFAERAHHTPGAPSENEDQHHRLVLYDIIMDLVPGFRDYLIQSKDVLGFANELQSIIAGVKSQDVYQIKTNLPDYVLPNLTVNKNDYFVPRAIGDVKETEWGWHSNVLARLLCPMKLVDQFDMDREGFRARVLAGEIRIASFDWPVFCYDESKFDPMNPKQGLFQGYLLLRVYRHIFTGPSSVFSTKYKGRLPRGPLNGLSEPTPATIGYAAIIARWALSSSPSLGDEDHDFRLDDFYYDIMELLDEEAPVQSEEMDRAWADETLAWWKANVPGLQRQNQKGKKSAQLSKPTNVTYFAERANRRERLERLSINTNPQAQGPLQPQPSHQQDSQQQSRPSLPQERDEERPQQQPHPPLPQEWDLPNIDPNLQAQGPPRPRPSHRQDSQQQSRPLPLPQERDEERPQQQPPSLPQERDQEPPQQQLRPPLPQDPEQPRDALTAEKPPQSINHRSSTPPSSASGPDPFSGPLSPVVASPHASPEPEPTNPSKRKKDGASSKSTKPSKRKKGDAPALSAIENTTGEGSAKPRRGGRRSARNK